MGRLSHVKVYLAGPIEFSNSNNATWRDQLVRHLIRIEPTFRIWSPLTKPIWASDACKNIDAALDKQALFDESLTSTERHQQAWDANVDSRHLCLHLANQADIIIARIPKTFTWGLIKELEDAGRRGIPIFMIMPDGPLGVFGLPRIISAPLLIPEYIHYIEETLLNKLTKINNGIDGLPESDPERWLFLTYPNEGDRYKWL